MLRITSKNTFSGPHQNQPVLTAGTAPEEAEAVIIMVHGRGAGARSILQLAGELKPSKKTAFLAAQASGFTWYPYSFLMPEEQNQPGLNSGLQVIYDLTTLAEEHGVAKENIYFLGFSQGACLASEFVARHPAKYGGLFVLSGGLIGESVFPENYTGDLQQTPVFMGCSDVDAHIPVSRLEESAAVFEKLNADLTLKIYPGMGHLVNEDEIAHINEVLGK